MIHAKSIYNPFTIGKTITNSKAPIIVKTKCCEIPDIFTVKYLRRVLAFAPYRRSKIFQRNRNCG